MRPWQIALILLAALRTLFSAEATADNVVSLPPLMVEEKGTPLKWRYVATPSMELLSICSDSTMTAFIEHYHRLDELLTEIVPRRFWARRTSPELHVVFNEEVGRARSQEVIAEMLQSQTGKTNSSAPAAPRSRGRLAGNVGARIRFLPNMRLTDSNTVAVFAILQDTPEAASGFTFTVERVSSLLQDRTPRLPEWFITGTLGFFARTKVVKNDVEIDSAAWSATEEADALKFNSDAPRTLLSVEDLLTHRVPAAGSALTEADQLWRAQCALFVRWAITANKGANKENLWKFVDRLEKEPLTEGLFREHFGMGFSDARDRLSDYLSTALEEKTQLPEAKSVPLPRLKVRAATDSEVARIRGGWERLEIAYVRKQFPDLVEKYTDQARRTLFRSYDRNDRDPRLVAEIGLTEIEAGNLVAARGFLEAAVQAGVARATPYYQLAVLRNKSVTPDASDPTKLTPIQTANVLEPVFAGLHFDPPLLENYLLMADVWDRSDTSPTLEQLTLFNDGVRLFAHSSPLIAHAIALNVSNGQTAAALELAESGMRAARDPAVRERLRALRDQLAAISPALAPTFAKDKKP